MAGMVKIELGGGSNPRGGIGCLNCDIAECADVQVDFETGVLPFADDSVDYVFSAHCLEHIKNAVGILRDVLRVAKIGAEFELHLPHWLHPMACCSGHVHVLSDHQVRLWCERPEMFWTGTGKRFMLHKVHYQIETTFNELRPLFPQLSDEQVAKYIPGCCHEVHYKMTIEKYDG
jgi:ubiquinone/menaquinone biosynthesis C-methylase UbiE